MEEEIYFEDEDFYPEDDFMVYPEDPGCRVCVCEDYPCCGCGC